MARFLIEPQSGGPSDILVNEDLSQTQKKIADKLYELVGPYKLYSDVETGADYATEASMKAAVAKKFGKYKSTLYESLSCEDYEDEGTLDLIQFKEAVLGVEEDLDPHLLDYVMWYVYVRSDNELKLEYKVLMQLVKEHNSLGKRPQSSKPAKS